MRFPTWLAALIATCILLTSVCLAIYLAAVAVKAVIDARLKLQKIRHKSEVKALQKWQSLYEDEQDARRADTNALIEEIGNLQLEINNLKKSIESKDELLAKVKVAEL